MEGVKVTHHTSKGRCLSATQSFTASQVVLRCEPYTAVLYDEQAAQRCDFCYQPCQRLLRCSRCKLVRYCNVEHQRKAWAQGHKQECEALQRCAPYVPPATVRLAARTLWKWEREQADSKPSAAYSCFGNVLGLLHHWDDLGDERKSSYAQVAMVVRQFMHGQSPLGLETNPSADPKQIAMLLARFASNNHTICDDELRPIGTGVYPLPSMANHSCSPNCMQSFVGSTIVFRALQPIHENEEVTISYIELAATRQERRLELLENYFFDIDARGNMEPCSVPSACVQSTVTTGSATANHSSAADMQQLLNHAATSTICRRPDITDTNSVSIEHQSNPLPGWQHSKGTTECSKQQRLASTVATNFLQGSISPPMLQYSTAGVTVRVVSCTAEPPWHSDDSDVLLTQVVEVAQTSSRSASRTSVLPGGLQACTVPGESNLEADSFPGLSGSAQDDLDNSDAERSVGAFADKSPSGPDTVQGVANRLGGNTLDIQLPCSIKIDVWGSWALKQSLESTPSLTNSSSQSCSNHVQVQQQKQMGISQSQSAQATLSNAAAALSSRVAQALHMQQSSVKLGATGKHVQAVRELQQALNLLDAPSGGGLGLGRGHVLRIRTLAAFLKAAIDSGSAWQEALQAARELQPLYVQVYPRTWPNLALHYATLAKLEMYLAHPKQAAAAAELALQQLKVTHPDSSIHRDMVQLMAEASAECMHLQYQRGQQGGTTED